METRCAWSKRRDPGTREIVLSPRNGSGPEQRWPVCPAHDEQLRRYYAQLERSGGVFLALLAMFVFALILFTILESEAGLGASVVFLGLMMLRLPFATPQTVQVLGVGTSIRVVRALAVLVVLAGVWQVAASF